MINAFFFFFFLDNHHKIIAQISLSVVFPQNKMQNKLKVVLKIIEFSIAFPHAMLTHLHPFLEMELFNVTLLV